MVRICGSEPQHARSIRASGTPCSRISVVRMLLFQSGEEGSIPSGSATGRSAVNSRQRDLPPKRRKRRT